MSQLLVIQMSNNTNPNGSPAVPWVDVNDSFVTALANPIKAFRRAPKGYTWRIYSVHFWMLTLNVGRSDPNSPGNINLDLNLWWEHKHQLGVGTENQRIARARIYYNKYYVDGNPDLLRDSSDTSAGLNILPGTGDVFTGARLIQGKLMNSDANTDWFIWRPDPHWNFVKGIITSPYLYFSVAHGGQNNMTKYLSSNSEFGVSIEYDHVKRMKWNERPFVNN